MGEIADAFVEAFRDFNVDGDPASGAYRPTKALIRAIGETIEQFVSERALNANGSSLAGGAGALLGNAGTFNTGIGRRAGQGSTGSRNFYGGEAAGFGANGSNSVYVGAGVAENAAGERCVFIGPIAGRNHVGDSANLIGYANFENVEGNRHIGIGDHAGAPPYTERPLANPSMNSGTNVLTTDPPTYYGGAVTGLVVGGTYRLQFENGSGTAPLPLASVSTLATLQSTGTRWTWLITSYDVTTDGAAGYVVGLCWYKWDDLICIGSGSPDGPNQIMLGFENTREILPNNNGLTAWGRSTELGLAYGKRGPVLLRDVVSRKFTAEAVASESALFDFVVNGVRRMLMTVSTAGNFSITRFNASGAATGSPMTIDNTTGNVTFSVQQGAGQGWTAATGTSSKGAFNTATATTQQCAERLKAIEDIIVQVGWKNA